MAKDFIDDEVELTEYDCSDSNDGFSVDIHSSDDEEGICEYTNIKFHTNVWKFGKNF